MDLYTILKKWSWLLAILSMFLKAYSIRRKADKKIALNPELEDGYRKIIKGYLVWGNIPWVVMGIGITIGGVPSVFHYLNFNSSNPYILAFFISVFFISIMGTYWILFKDGAEMIAKHPTLLSYDVKSPMQIKIFWSICVVGGIVAVVLMHKVPVNIPK